MNIFCSNLSLFKNISVRNIQNKEQPPAVTYPNFSRELSGDVFIKTSPNFGSTSNGKFLLKLKKARDPYSGVDMIFPKDMENILRQLKEKNTITGKLKVLDNYTDSMLPVEKGMYSFFREVNKKDKRLNFSDILKMQYPYAIKGLTQHQNHIFNSIEKSTQNISQPNKEKVLAELKEAKERILLPEEDNKHRFKRKVFIDKLVKIQSNNILDKVEENIQTLPKTEQDIGRKALENAKNAIKNNNYDTYLDNEHRPIDLVKELHKKYIPEVKDEMSEIIDIANTLPSSSDSMNAFIVKYADRSNKEICERLITPSKVSIEHLHADSLGGENEASNFILATASRNSERGNMPIPEFRKKYPNIPKYMQAYIDDVIEQGNKGKLYGYEWYPYLVKDSIKKEAGINVNISRYKIKPEDAFKTLPPRLRDSYPKYLQYIPGPTEPFYHSK